MKHTTVLAPILLLAGCGGGASGPGGVTAEEARALDEAAQMIESRRLPPEALAPMTPGPEHGPPAQGAPAPAAPTQAATQP